MIDMIRKRPWLLVLFGLLLMTSMTIAFVIVAVMNPPELVR